MSNEQNLMNVKPVESMVSPYESLNMDNLAGGRLTPMNRNEERESPIAEVGSQISQQLMPFALMKSQSLQPLQSQSLTSIAHVNPVQSSLYPPQQS